MEDSIDVLLQFSHSHVEQVIQRILSAADAVNSVTKPVATILGGQPGAGKTTLADLFTEQLHGNALFISGDAYRKLHPNCAAIIQKYGRDGLPLMGAFSGAVTEGLIERAAQLKYNLVIEGTLRTTEVPIKTCKLLKQYGYQVDLACMAVKPTLSYFSTLHRYELMQEYGTAPRATPKASHDNVAAMLGKNLDTIHDSQIFDRILLYTRSKLCIYDSSVMNVPPPSVVLRDIHEGVWTEAEVAQLQSTLVSTLQLMRKRNAPELEEFLQEKETALLIFQSCEPQFECEAEMEQ